MRKFRYRRAIEDAVMRSAEKRRVFLMSMTEEDEEDYPVWRSEDRRIRNSDNKRGAHDTSRRAPGRFNS